GLSGASLAAELFDSGRILPVLDGFDEVAGALHRPALDALRSTNAPLVLTSRSDEYAAAVRATNVLASAAAVELDDLTMADLVDYLPRTTRRTAPGGFPIWDTVLDRLRNDAAAAALRHVLATPLMVFLARAIYSERPGRDPVEMLDSNRFGSPEAIEDH